MTYDGTNERITFDRFYPISINMVLCLLKLAWITHGVDGRTEMWLSHFFCNEVGLFSTKYAAGIKTKSQDENFIHMKDYQTYNVHESWELLVQTYGKIRILKIKKSQ